MQKHKCLFFSFAVYAKNINVFSLDRFCGEILAFAPKAYIHTPRGRKRESKGTQIKRRKPEVFNISHYVNKKKGARHCAKQCLTPFSFAVYTKIYRRNYTSISLFSSAASAIRNARAARSLVSSLSPVRRG